MRRGIISRLILGLAFAFTLAVPPVQSAAGSPDRQASAQPGGFVPGELMVGLADNVQPSALGLPDGATLAPSDPNLSELGVVKLLVPAGKEMEYRTQLLQDADVLFAEPNYYIHAALIPNDPLWGPSPLAPFGQYGPIHINAPAAWDVTTGSASTILAILDSGIDSSHPEFKGRLVPGYDFIDNDSTPEDLYGHGTHVAGIAAATGNNAIGVAGIDWKTKIMPVRVLDQGGGGTFEGVAKGIVWAVKHGAHVINMSLGACGPSPLLEYSTYYAYFHGVAVIAAAGNQTPYCTDVLYPAAYPWVLAVGATDITDQRAYFSNTGPALDVVAPGDNIISTTPMKGSFALKSSDTPNQYGLLSGTSMASPFVAGAAALLSGQPGFNTPDKIYSALEQTASHHTTHDDYTGYGLIQIDKALAFDTNQVADPTAIPLPSVDYDMLSSSRCQNVPFNWLEVPNDPVLRNQSYQTGGYFVGIFDNDSSQTIDFPTGFQFDFGGKPVPSVTVSDNGYLTFNGENGTLPDNFLIPASDPNPDGLPGSLIAPFWDDLSPSSDTARIYAFRAGTDFVVEWSQLPILANFNNSSVTFEVVLQETSNQILFQYDSLNGPQSDGSSATIGIQYNNGTEGQQYAYNQVGALKSGQAIRFDPLNGPVDNHTISGCLFSTTVTNAGGFFSLPPFCLDVPSGVLQQDSLLHMNIFKRFPPSPSAYHSLSEYASIAINPMPRPLITPPLTVCYDYSARDLLQVGGDPHNLFMAEYDTETNQWNRLPTSVDAASHRITSPVAHLSIFGVFGTQPSHLPVTGAPLSLPWLALVGLGLACLALVGWRLWIKK
ncbi:MAG: S8 family peptidase [Anaerolineaceae bacterium]|nr:S8 family peptidase [Anaerolineaceae bacterium]